MTVKTALFKLRNRLTRVDKVLADLEVIDRRIAEFKSAGLERDTVQEHRLAELMQQLANLHVRLDALSVDVAKIWRDFDPIVQAQQDLQTTLAGRSQTLQSALADHSQALEALKFKLSRIEKRIELASIGESKDASASQQESLTRRIRVHFFFQLPEVWTTWESVWFACSRSERIETSIVLLPFHHHSAGDPKRARRFLANEAIPFVNYAAYKLDDEQPDIVFLQNPYDSTRPTELSVESLVQCNARIAYIPYGLEVGGGSENLRWQYDCNVQRNAWRVFVRSEQQRRMFGLYCETGSRHVVVTGHPKIDNIVSRCPPNSGMRSGAAIDYPKVVLWAPHFSVEPGGWSTFMTLHDAILRYFEEKPTDLVLVVRPHPLFFGRLRELDNHAGAMEAALRRRFHQPPFISLDENPLYTSSFESSDALMADAGSFLLEYLPTEKPILYLHNPKGPGLNESADFVRSYYQAEDFPQVKKFFEMIQSGDDERRDERVSLTKKLLHRTDGTVGAHIRDYIVSEFSLCAKTLGRAKAFPENEGKT